MVAALAVHAHTQDELHPSVVRHMRMMRRGMPSNDLELAVHNLEFRQTGAMCNAEEADAYWQTHPFVHSVSSTETQVQVMQAVKELKKLLLLVDVPLVLVRDVLLGWRRSCFAVPGKSGATVATFGPWLADLGLSTLKKVLRAKGHQLDEDCPHGPTEPNCKLRARLHIDKSWVLVDLLLFRFLTLKDRCDVSSCGTGCRLCPLALEVPGNAKASRPVPIRAFRLAVWLNDTFWIPADVDRYLAVEYGPTWYEFSDALVPMPSHAALAERVREKQPSLPSKSQVSGTQKLVETASWKKIAAAVGSELELWQRYFPEVRPSTSVGSLWQQKPEPDRALWDLVRGPVAAEQNLSHGSTSVWLVVGGLLLAASLLLREAPVSLALPTPGAYGAPPVLAFGLYCFLWCVRALLQRAACEDGANHSPLACSLAVALLQCCTSAGLLPAIRAVGGAKSFRQTWYSRPAGVPVWQLTVAAGAVHSARVWLSFVSLSFLDPLSFVLLAAFQVSIELLLPWRERPGQPQGHLRYLALAMALLAALCQGEELWHAGARKMLGVAAALAYALLGTLLTFLHNKVSRLDISKDLMQLGQHAAGFLVLLACGLALSDLPASLAGLWQSALASRFIFLCGLCIVALNVGSPYLLEEVPQPLALLGPGVCLLGVAVLQICLSEAMAMPAPSSRTLQALLLGLMAALLHAAAGVPKGKAAPIPPAAKATPRPASANPALQELVKGRRPPKPKPPLSACRKDSSEVGSTATPPTSNDAASSDVAASSDRGLESDSDVR